MRKFIFCFMLLSTLFNLINAQVDKAIIKDIEYFKEEFPKTGYFKLNKTISLQKFNHEIDLLLDSVAYYSNEEALFNLSSILAKTKDSHTGFSFPAKRRFPIQYIMLKGKVYISSCPSNLVTTIDNETTFLSEELCEISNIPVQTILDKIQKIIPIDNQSSIKNVFSRFLEREDFLRFVDVTNTSYYHIKNNYK